MPNYSGMWTVSQALDAIAAGNWVLPPGAPTSVTATGGNESASVAFTAPTNTGTPAGIASYTVTSSPGGFTGTGASSPITVSGLTNGTAYTFTVTATATNGLTGPASSASNSVTPALPSFITNLYAGSGTSVTTDSSGNIYVYGNNSGSYMQIAKYSLAGVLQWQKYFTESVSAFGRITIDSSSNIIFVSKVGSGSSQSINVLKVNSSGTSVWQKQITGFSINSCTGNINLVSVYADSSDNIYIGAVVQQTVGYTYTITKLNSSGTHQFSRRLGNGYAGSEFTAITVDSSGNIYAACAYNSGNYVGVIIKYDSGGTLQWQRTVAISGNSCYLRDIACDSSGNVYAVGIGSNYAVVVKYDSSGTSQWGRSLSSGSISGYGIAVDSSGNVYTTGYDVFNYLLFITKYSTDGVIQWQRTLNATDRRSFGYDIHVGSDGNPVAIGLTYNTSNTDPRFIIAKVPSDGSKTGTYSLSGYSWSYSASSFSDSSLSATYGTSAGSNTNVTYSVSDHDFVIATSSLTSATTTL